MTDTKIATGILSRLQEKDRSLLLDVTADVWEQRVLLTGTLDDPAQKEEVASLVRADNRVRKVYNEILIVSTEEKEQRREQKKQAEKGEEGNTGGDYCISGKIKALLLSATGVTSVNYRWHTIKSAVYPMGRARSQSELEKVLSICRTTDGVANVKHFIEIKPI